MSQATAEAAIIDIVNYARRRQLTSVSIVIHGGEPSLMQGGSQGRIITAARDLLAESGVKLGLCVQTNAFKIPESVLEVWMREGVDIGVSVDLSPALHDAYRIDPRGNGTYEQTLRGIEAIRRRTQGAQPVSALAVIETDVAPVDAWDHLVQLGLAYYDLLLPDQNWNTAGPEDLQRQYAGWLIEMWDLYILRPRNFRIRWFNTIIKLVQGGVWGSDSLGMNSAGTLIVDTDGKYVFHDALRTAGFDINQTGQSAGSNSIMDIESLPTMRAMMDKASHLPITCRSCASAFICGGGHIVHRFSADEELRQRSVYCFALKEFYEHAQRSLTTILGEATV